jgi:hypothetical protein
LISKTVNLILIFLLCLSCIQAASEPVPNLKELLADVDANQKKIDAAKETFSAGRVEEEIMTDKAGRVLKGTTNEFTFYYLRGIEVSTLRRQNGQSLSPEAQRREEERSRKLVGRILKEGKKQDSKKKDEKEDVEISTFLRVATIGAARREESKGRKLVVFDFDPNPTFKARTDEEKIAQRLQGTIFIDEESRVVRRIEARFANDYRVGGLLAKVEKGSSFVVEQDLFDGVWLPSYEEGVMKVSVLGIKEVSAKIKTRYFNYSQALPGESVRMTSP